MNTSHYYGGALEVILRNASDVTGRPRPLHQWFEKKDHHAWKVVRIQRKILHCQETGESLEHLKGALANEQLRLENITRKCDQLFFQWNCLGRGGRK